MIVNGYITTQFPNIPESMLDDNNVSYDDIKDHICKHSSLSQYLITVAHDFHIPCLRPYLSNTTYPQAVSINDINSGSLFANLPTDRCLDIDEINIFGKIVDDKIRYKFKLFEDSGLPHPVRLCNHY